MSSTLFLFLLGCHTNHKFLPGLGELGRRPSWPGDQGDGHHGHGPLQGYPGQGDQQGCGCKVREGCPGVLPDEPEEQDQEQQDEPDQGQVIPRKYHPFKDESKLLRQAFPEADKVRNPKLS